MAQPTVLTDEQRIENHRAGSLKWSRENAELRRVKARDAHSKNKDKINARRRELRAIKKKEKLEQKIKTI